MPATGLPIWESPKQGPRLLAKFLVKVLVALMPSFVSLPGGMEGVGKRTLIGKAHATSYLDGLRGFAACIVFNTHLSPILSRRMGAGWGHVSHATNSQAASWLQLPFVHALHAGGYPIHLFFLISGLAGSFSAVKAFEARPQNSAVFFTKTSAGIFRRPLRLYIPSWASTIFVFAAVRFDLFNAVDRSKNNQVITGWPLLADWPQRTPSVWQQLFHLIEENLRMLRLMGEGDSAASHNQYNGVLWTIPLEFLGSLLLYLAHCSHFYVPRQKRILSICLGISLTVFIGQIFVAVFWAGWLLAETASWTAARGSQFPKLMGPTGHRRHLWTVANIVGLYIALYLASYPRYEPNLTRGFQSLHAITPPAIGLTSDFWHAVAAAMTVYCVGQLPSVSKFLSLPLFRYFGRISFALYLSHFWILHLVGTLVFSHAWTFTGRATMLAESIGFVMAYTTTLGLCVWVADLYVRYVETPCTRLAVWLQDWFTANAVS